MKKLHKILQATIIALLVVLIGIPMGVYVVVSTPWAQDALRRVACVQISNLLGTEVSIDRVSYQPFNTISVTGLHANDDSGRRALEVARVSARFEVFTFLRSGRFVFDYAVVEGPAMTLWRQTPESPLNIQGIIDRLKPKEQNKPPREFDLSIGTVVLTNGHVTYDVRSEQPLGDRFDANHIKVDNVNLHAYLRQGSRDLWDVALESFSFTERSGFSLEKLQADACVAIGSKDVEVRELSIDLPASHLALRPLKLNINDFSTADAANGNFINIRQQGNAYVSLGDLACFVPAFTDIDRRINIGFDIDLSSRDVRIKSIGINDTKETSIDIAGKVDNYRSRDGIDAELSNIDIRTNATDIAQALTALGNNKLNKFASHIGSVHIFGSAAGNVDGASADLKANALSASLAVKGNVTTPDRYKSMAIDGDMNIAELDLGRLTGRSDLGSVTASATASANIAASKVTGAGGHVDIANFTYKEHNYSNISIEGDYDGSLSKASANIVSDDPAAVFELNADAVLGGTYELSLDGNIFNFEPATLGLSEKYQGFRACATINSHLSGRTVDDANGYIDVRNIAFVDSTESGLNIDRLSVSLDRSGSKDIATVESDFLNGSIQGHIAPSTLVQTLSDMVAHITPALFTKSTTHYEDLRPLNQFEANFTLSNAEKLSEFFKLPVQIIYPINITASVDAVDGLATMTVDAPYLQQGDKIIEQTVADAVIDTSDDRAMLYATTRMPTKKGPMVAVVGVSGTDNRLDTRIDWLIDRKIPLNGQINFSTTLERDEEQYMCINTDFNPGEITFGDDVWAFGASTINYCDRTITADNFTLKSGEQSIAISGVASPSESDTLNVSLRNIHLASIFETLEIDKALIGGRASGDFTATRALSSMPALSTTGLHVDSIGYNYCTLGNADVAAHWDNDRQSFFLDADIVNPEGQHSRIWGDIFAMREALDLNFDAKHVKVGFMKPFMQAFTSDVTGYVSGKARLFGTFKDIDLEGDVFAEDLKLKIDFTNTWYTATDSIHITPGLINLEDITIADVNGQTAKLNGWLRHDYFHSPVFEFKVSDAHDFLSYNVNSRLNPDWYGTIYGNGGATVKGRPGVVEIGVDMATAPHSTFTFVLSDHLEAEQYSFITFNDRTVYNTDSLLNVDDTPTVVKEYQARRSAANADEPSAYIMDIKVDITPDAELIIVMDPIGGDRIRAYGSGDMSMQYNSTDNFLGMRGTYTLDRGNYNFTLQDIIIKDFTIEPGSSITFKGDPYQAELNLQAVYALNANLSDLDESFTQDRELNRTNVPVHALLNVTGDMRQPEISFDLRFPTLSSDTYRKVKSIISTEDMMSRQIIYLLALNRFYTPDYMASTTKGNEIFSVAASTISSQISNMLGKLSDKWSIAPNLRSDRGDFSDVEVDVALSSRLLNNRLLLNGNFGYRDKSLNTNQFIGDFDIEYLLTPQGTWRLRAYNRYNDQNYYVRSAATTQGIGIMFRRDFDSLFPRPKPKITTYSIAPEQ